MTTQRDFLKEHIVKAERKINNNMPFNPHKYLKEEKLQEHIPLNDMEGEMAIAELQGVIEYANEILGMLKPETQLEAWVQSKITKSKDYLDSVSDYLKRTPGSIE